MGGYIVVGSHLALGAVDNVLVAIRGELGLGGLDMPPTEEEVGNIAVHQEASRVILVVLGIVPCKVNS